MIANENGMYSVAGQVYTNSRESLANKPVLYAEGVRGKQFEKNFIGITQRNVFLEFGLF